MASFAVNFLPRLPAAVVASICELLPPEYVSEAFLRLRGHPLRDLVVDQYYSREMHFVLSPTPRPHPCRKSAFQRLLTDLENYADADDFLSENPDISPSTVKIITGGDYRSLEVLLHTHRQRLLNVNKLEIHIHRYEPSDEELAFVCSFPNLSRLHFTNVKFSRSVVLLQTQLENLSQLQELVLLGHHVESWEKVRLPKNIRHIDISWNVTSDISTLAVPELVTEIYWNQAGVNNSKLLEFNFPSSLKTLMLTYNNISSLNISRLPRTLETLDLSYNVIHDFLVDGSTAWPPNLKSILLSHNKVDDVSLEHLSQAQWPPFLQNLKLDNNPFTSLASLINLPDNLAYLDLSESRLMSLEVSTELYPFFRFPDFLDALNLSGCEKLVFYDHADPSRRIRFPSTLLALNLSECGVRNLGIFLFPPSLAKLSLTGNKIEDLTSYNLHASSGENVVDWNQLAHLEELELYFNNVSGLAGWEVPPNLRILDLRMNKLTEITPICTPLFSKDTDNLRIHTLNLESNAIAQVHSGTTLPSSVVKLSISKNRISGVFTIPRGFVAHPSLRELDLSANTIERLVFGPEHVPNSQLRLLNLSSNRILKDKSDPQSAPQRVQVFYDMLRTGLGVDFRRKANVNSVHAV